VRWSAPSSACQAVHFELFWFSRWCRQENFKRWNNALQTKNPATVAALYDAGNLSFLPTISPEHIRDLESAEEYFVTFVKMNPFGTITDDCIHVFGFGEAYLHSGLYTFEMGEPSDRSTVKARFSFLWQNINGEWKITHHHSSRSPWNFWGGGKVLAAFWTHSSAEK